MNIFEALNKIRKINTNTNYEIILHILLRSTPQHCEQSNTRRNV